MRVVGDSSNNTPTRGVCAKLQLVVLRLRSKLQPGILPFPVLRLWDQNTMLHAGTMNIASQAINWIMLAAICLRVVLETRGSYRQHGVDAMER